MVLLINNTTEDAVWNWKFSNLYLYVSDEQPSMVRAHFRRLLMLLLLTLLRDIKAAVWYVQNLCSSGRGYPLSSRSLKALLQSFCLYNRWWSSCNLVNVYYMIVKLENMVLPCFMVLQVALFNRSVLANNVISSICQGLFLFLTRDRVQAVLLELLLPDIVTNCELL